MFGPLLFLLCTADVGELAAAVSASHLILTPMTGSSIRGATLHLVYCSGTGWSWVCGVDTN